MLITSYAQLINGVSKFQSWQIVVRYGGKALSEKSPAEFQAAVGFAIGLDLVSGVGGTIVAIGLLPLIGTRFGVPERYVLDAMLYCSLLPAMASATPTGVLRALKRFDLIGWQATVFPILRAMFSGIAWAAHAPLGVFVVIWYITNLGNDVLLWILALRELRQRKLLQGIRPSLRPRGLAGAWRFALYTNLHTGVLAAVDPLSRLVVGALLGPAAVGLYRVALSVADAVGRPTDLLLKTYYPQVVGMDFRSKEPWRLMIRITAISSFVGLLMSLFLVVGGRWIIAGIFGRHFIAAYQPLLILCVAAFLSMTAFPLSPMLYSLDRPQAPVKARVIGTTMQFILIVPLIASFGLSGAAGAYVIGYAISIMFMVVSLAREYGRLRTNAGA
jgi:O-antigen/teichoic acid export membrane protein